MRRVLFFCLLLAAAGAHAKPAWREADIPLLPKGASLGSLWAGLSGDLYVWAETRGGPAGDVPTAHLLHWNGASWRKALTLAGHAPAGVFGLNASHMFAAVNKCAAGTAAGCGADRGARVFRSEDGGVTWIPQDLTPAADGRAVTGLSGSFDNVQVLLDNSLLLRFDGVAWKTALEMEDDKAGHSLAFAILGANEGYLTACDGWGRWRDGAWKFMPAEFGFCEARGLWGIRDNGGILRLYAVDSHRFGNGVRVWEFDAPAEDFNLVFEEASEDESGAAEGIWGSAQDDIYVIGQIGSTRRAGQGRVYHFNGKTWRKVTELGALPVPRGIHGTSRNDVWIAFADGRLFHYSTATAVTRRMAGPSTAE